MDNKGQKFNNDKLPLDIVVCKQFPKALKAIARCTEYGHQKYIETDADYQNFRNVKGGAQTYADALMRHAMQVGNDEESGLPHAFHKAWNALAELELVIRDAETWADSILEKKDIEFKNEGRRIESKIAENLASSGVNPYNYKV